MSEDWDHILAGLLRPARPGLTPCLRSVAEYSAARADRAQGRIRALSEIESRIGAARARVFAAGTGVVSAEMTALEREWLAASRDRSSEGDLERLWVRLAPERWLGQPPRATGSAEAIATLASDPEGVEDAERAASELRAALATWGVSIGARIDWCVSDELTFAVRAEELFSAPIAAMSEVAGHAAIQAAHRLRREICGRLGRLEVQTRNSSIVRELGVLAFATSLWDAAATRLDAPRSNPIAPALAIIRLGYVLTVANDAGVVLTSLPARAATPDAGT